MLYYVNALSALSYLCLLYSHLKSVLHVDQCILLMSYQNMHQNVEKLSNY